MGFECLNGRLRRIHIPTSLMMKNDKKKYDEESLLSILPFTLPHGIIATFNVSLSTSSSSSSSSSNNSHTSMSFMLHKLKEVHRMKGYIIIDHCWSIIVNENYHDDDDDDKNREIQEREEEYILVLAVATRLSNYGYDNNVANAHYDNSNVDEDDSVCKVFIYSRPIDLHENDDTNHNYNKSIDLIYDMSNDSKPNKQKQTQYHNNNDDEKNDSQKNNDDQLLLSSIFQNVHEINLSQFVTCISMDDNILVIGSYIGASVYDIRCILSQSISIQHQKGQGKGQEDMVAHAESLIQPIRLMKSCIVQAISISYPYLAAASGDRVGLWRIDSLMKYISIIKSQNGYQEVNKKTNDDDNQEEDINVDIRKYLTACWTTKVDIGQSRITCLEMMTSPSNDFFLALSCWDGSAVVFCRSDISNNGSKELWSRIDPRVGDNPIINDDDNDKREIKEESNENNGIPTWEDQVIDSDIMFPCFLSLFTLSNDNNKNCRNIMAVSCLGHAIVRCYDLDSKEWIQDVGTINPDTYNCDVKISSQGKT